MILGYHTILGYYTWILYLAGIHTGFSAKGGETGGRTGWAAIVECLSLETLRKGYIFVTPPTKDQIEIAINYKNFFRSLGGEIRCLRGNIPGLPPFCMNPCLDTILGYYTWILI